MVVLVDYRPRQRGRTPFSAPKIAEMADFASPISSLSAADHRGYTAHDRKRGSPWAMSPTFSDELVRANRVPTASPRYHLAPRSRKRCSMPNRIRGTSTPGHRARTYPTISEADTCPPLLH